MSVKLFFLLSSVLSCHAQSAPRCLLQPLPGPEILYNFYNCSAEIDWSRSVTEDCQNDAISYEVEFLMGCTNNTLKNFTNETMFLLNKNIGEYFNCYARVRTQLRDDSWSNYSAWTSLSNTSETIESK